MRTKKNNNLVVWIIRKKDKFLLVNRKNKSHWQLIDNVEARLLIRSIAKSIGVQ